MKRFVYRGCLFFLLFLLAPAWVQAASAPSREGKKSVLILHSYHKAAWTDKLTAGIRSALDRTADVDIAVEYMDTKRIKTAAYFQALEKVYSLKYADTVFDVVIVSDDNAFDFALPRQDGLFKGAPIVFCGVNRFDPEKLEGKPQVTGVVEKGDFEETLRFAARVRPKADAVYVVLDHTHTGQLNEKGFLAALKRRHPQLSARYLTDLSVADLASALAAADPSDFAFFISYWQDDRGRHVSPDTLSEAFHQSAVPIFGRSEWMINKGMTGGKCVSGFDQGAAAGRMAARIMNGESASAIPVALNSPNRFMFDHEMLMRYGIDPSDLPAKSTVYNRPKPTFYEKYEALIWATAAVLAVLTALVLVLAYNSARRLRMEKALRASEARFRALVENAVDAIFLVGRKGNVVDVNPKACESLGYNRRELLQCRVRDFDADFDNEEALEGLWDRLCLNRSVGIESRHLRKDGTVFPVQLRIGLLEIDDKPFAMCMAHDITERKQMEAELRESEARYRQLVQHAPAGIYEIDLKKFRFVSVNDVMCEYTGYSREEFMEMSPDGLLTDESIAAFARRLKNLTPDDPTPTSAEYQIRGKNGRAFWVLVNARFSFENGVPVRAMAVAHDLTALRKTEAEKKRLEAKLAQVQKIEALGTLAGGIAHDFNNLLMGIQGNASLMLHDKGRGPDDAQRLHNIEQYIQRGVELTGKLLGLGRGGKYEVRPADPNRLVKECAEMFGRTKKEIRIVYELKKGVWTIACDQGQIDQVLFNILINAWQAMPDGGDLHIATANTVLDEAFVQPHSAAPGRYVKISITDTGIGMDQATMARIFDPFFTTKERGRGTGLGLASAYGIVKNHDGIIDMTSQIGQGSTFNIYLPTAESEVDDSKPADSRLIDGSEKILLVDDEEMVLDVGAKMLEKLGYAALKASSGREALEIYREHHESIDMVVLDMIMPEMSGAEAFDRLREIDPDARVLLSSGYSLDGQATDILARGCLGFIQKPFNLQELSQKVREVLDRETQG